MRWTLLLFPISLLAQSAELSGFIKDSLMAGVPNASVELRNEDTGAISRTKTNSEGIYTIGALNPGTYDATVQANGFKTATRDGIVLQVEQRARLDITLELGSVEEKITVRDTAPLVQDTPEIETSITRREYESLPMIQIGRIRSPATFVLLAPGVQGSVRLDGAQYSSASNHVQVHGQPNFTTEYLIDGLPGGPGYGNLNESAPAVDAVREFRLITTLPAAEYGASGTAVASFALMSGTNQLHGGFYNYLRNSALDARSFLAASVPPLRLNEFGVSVGGPVVLPRLYNGKDRAFFFFSYGGSRKRGADAVSTAQIPTQPQVRGDFSGLKNSAGQPVMIYDPATTHTDANGNLIRDPFPGNVIPGQRIDTAAAKIASYFPAPNSPLGYTNYLGEQLLDPDAYTTKVDHALSAQNRLAMSLIRTNIPRLRFGSALPEPISGTGSFLQHVRSWTIRLNDDWILSPTLLNSLSLGFNRFETPLGPTTKPQDWASALNMPGLGTYAFPVINFGSGYQGLGSSNFFDYIDATGLLKDNVSWQHGAHSLKFGGEWRYNQHDSPVVGNTYGIFNFTNTYTANPTSLTTSGDSFASFLLGGYRSVSSSGPYSYSARWNYGGLYLQDQWRLNSRLTLTLGLRWEWQTPTSEGRDQRGGVSLDTPNPGAGNRPGTVVFGANGHSFGSTDFTSVGPRIGIAWSPIKDTAIRAGYGIYYSKYTSGSNYFGIDSPGYQASFERVSQDNGMTAAGRLSEGLPAPSNTPNLSPTVLNGQAATYVDPSSWRLPRTQNWTVSIQRELMKDIVFEASYVGLHATRQNAYLMLNINQVDPRYLSLGPLLTQSISSPAVVAAGIPLPYPGFTGTVAQALRPYPQYQTLTSFYAKPGKSTYHALELHLRRRFASGLLFDANYTWSKNLGYADTVNAAVGGVNNLLPNAYNQAAEYSLLPTDFRTPSLPQRYTSYRSEKGIGSTGTPHSCEHLSVDGLSRQH